MKSDKQTREKAEAWCEDHQREIHAGGLTLDEAAESLVRGHLYRVDTTSAGLDMIIDAADEDDALFVVAEFGGFVRDTSRGTVVDEDRTRGWSAKRVTI